MHESTKERNPTSQGTARASSPSIGYPFCQMLACPRSNLSLSGLPLPSLTLSPRSPRLLLPALPSFPPPHRSHSIKHRAPAETMSSNNSYRHARQTPLPLPLGTTARTIEDSNLSLQADNYLMFDALRAAKCGRLTSSQLDQILSWCRGGRLQLHQNGFDQWADRTLHFRAVLGSSSSVQDNSAPFWATPGPQATPAQF